MDRSRISLAQGAAHGVQGDGLIAEVKVYESVFLNTRGAAATEASPLDLPLSLNPSADKLENEKKNDDFAKSLYNSTNGAGAQILRICSPLTLRMRVLVLLRKKYVCFSNF